MRASHAVTNEAMKATIPRPEAETCRGDIRRSDQPVPPRPNRVARGRREAR
jgi:hypothetical protein